MTALKLKKWLAKECKAEYGDAISDADIDLGIMAAFQTWERAAKIDPKEVYRTIIEEIFAM